MNDQPLLLYGVDDTPPFWTTLMLGFQYVLLNLGGIMLSPIIISAACGLGETETEYLIFVTVLVSSLATLIQVRRIGKIGSGYLMILGPSGAFLSCSISAVAMGGLPLLGTMTLLSAPLEAGVGYLIGVLRKVFTPALGGTVIMLVAMLIIPLTIGMWTGEEGDPFYYSPQYFFSGLVPFLIILGSFLSDRSWVRLWSPVAGVILGVMTAMAMGIADFSQVSSYSLLALPQAGWPGLTLELGWRHMPLFLTFLMATLVSSVETFGDTVALQTVSEGKLRKIDYDRIQGGFYVDTVGSMMAGAAGSLANTTYSTVMPVIRLTRVSSRVVGYYAAVMLGVVAFLPKVAHFFMAIPDPVMGGMSIGLMVILFGEGFKVAASADRNTENGLVIGTGLSMGLLASMGQFFPGLFPDEYQYLASDVISVGGLSALLLNVLFIYKLRKTENLTLTGDLLRLPELQKKIDAFEDRFRMTGEQKYAMQLACEEVFAFFCHQNTDDAEIIFRWKYHPDYVITEIVGKGELTDVDIQIDPDRMRSMDDESLQELGLYLLARVANGVEHAHIDGTHYIQFRV